MNVPQLGIILDVKTVEQPALLQCVVHHRLVQLRTAGLLYVQRNDRAIICQCACLLCGIWLIGKQCCHTLLDMLDVILDTTEQFPHCRTDTALHLCLVPTGQLAHHLLLHVQTEVSTEGQWCCCEPEAEPMAYVLYCGELLTIEQRTQHERLLANLYVIDTQERIDQIGEPCLSVGDLVVDLIERSSGDLACAVVVPCAGHTVEPVAAVLRVGQDGFQFTTFSEQILVRTHSLGTRCPLAQLHLSRSLLVFLA